MTLHSLPFPSLLPPQDRLEVSGSRLKIKSLALVDSGMYQCVAENKHGTIYSTAELRVQGRRPNRAQLLGILSHCRTIALLFLTDFPPRVLSVHAPDFRLNPVKKLIPAARGGQVMIECRPRAAPKPSLFWSRGTELLTNSSR